MYLRNIILVVPRRKNWKNKKSCREPSNSDQQQWGPEPEQGPRKRKVKSLSRVWLFATPWTIAYQSPLSMGFSRQGYWSGLPFPSPEDLPDPGIKPGSPKLQADALPSEPAGKPGPRTERRNQCEKYRGSRISRGFPGGTGGKGPICQCRRHKKFGFCPWVRKIPWRKEWQPTPVFLPGESMNRAWGATVHGVAKSWTWLSS